MSLLLYLSLSMSFAQEAKRDCLTGLCLGAPASTPIANSLTSVVDHSWQRRVKVCAGKVVEITLSTGWAAPSFAWSDIAEGAVTHLGSNDDFGEAVLLEKSVKAVLNEVGWVNYDETRANSPAMAWVTFYKRPEVLDERRLMFLKSDDLKGVGLILWTTHADKNALCAPELARGL